MSEAAAPGSAFDSLLSSLIAYRSPGVFNQYAEVNLDYDRPDGAARRQANLRRYFEAFQNAAYVLISEAPGFAGCRFSGVSFTDERFLVGPTPLAWVREAGGFARSSRDDRPLSREMSATIVWSALGDRRDIVFWPAFPWHPMGARGPLSNRAPRRDELLVGRNVLDHVLRHCFPGREVQAVGRYAQAALSALDVPSPTYIRHPSQGGASEFRRAIAALPRAD
jgi:hypothetical protein